jgi:hypothetical protein
MIHNKENEGSVTRTVYAYMYTLLHVEYTSIERL